MQAEGPSLTVLDPGPLCLVEDHGRPGWAHLGVPRAGALDRPAADLANRCVGNPEGTAVLEVLLGGLVAVPSVAAWVAVTGAAVAVSVDGRPVAHGEPVRVGAGATLRLGRPGAGDGLRSWVAVTGGVAVAPVLGSRSTDTLAGVGPPPVAAGTVLPLGDPVGAPRPVDVPPSRRAGPLRIDPGPRADWLAGDAVAALCRTSYVVRGESDRAGLRLDGSPLDRARDGELATEGMVCGAVQVPPDGRPVVFLADHPPTGGYPVVAVVRADDLWRCAQLRPGDPVRFTPARR